MPASRYLGRDAEGHHHMKIAVVPDDLDDAWREGAAELERDLWGHQARQRIGDEARVESDRRGLPFDGGVDTTGVVTDLRCVGGDHEWRIVGRVHLKSQHVRGITGEIR